jgi:hypothetical protein
LRLGTRGVGGIAGAVIAVNEAFAVMIIHRHTFASAAPAATSALIFFLPINFWFGCEMRRNDR